MGDWSSGPRTVCFLLGFDFRLQHHLSRAANGGYGDEAGLTCQNCGVQAAIPDLTSWWRPSLWCTGEGKRSETHDRLWRTICWDAVNQKEYKVACFSHWLITSDVNIPRKQLPEKYTQVSWQCSEAMSDCPKWLITANKHVNKPIQPPPPRRLSITLLVLGQAN